MQSAINSFYDYLFSLTSISRIDFDLCAPYLEHMNIEKGELFVREGARCSKIAFVYKGIFKVFYTKDGHEVNTCFCAEKSISSSFESFINGTLSKESIQAIEESVVLCLSREALDDLYEKSIAWQRIGRMLTEKECLRLAYRNNSLSFETALQKYSKLLEDQPDLIRRVPIQDLASYIGVSRETLSRIRATVASK